MKSPVQIPVSASHHRPDAVELVAAPTEPAGAAARRARGRPLGARTRLLREDQALGLQHFAYFRAVVQGLEPRLAWQRYLVLRTETPEPRRVQSWHHQLWADLLQRAQWRCADLPPQAPLVQALRLLKEPKPQSPSARALPSLEEFIAHQGLDPDHYSQAELLQEYAEHHGLNTQPSQDERDIDRSTASQLRALATLSDALVQQPSPADRLELWLAAPTLQPLLAAGLGTLADLGKLVHTRGERWWRAVPGLGHGRAQALSGWLQQASAAWPVPVRWTNTPPAARAMQRLAPWPRQARLAVPMPLRLAEDWALAHEPEDKPRAGPTAAHRSVPQHPAEPCWQRALAWLETLGPSAATRRAYSKEAERFVLWCHHERNKRLDQATSADLQAYAEFLAHLPAHWVEPEPLPRSAARWRPFRGPLAPSSMRYALALVERLVAATQGRALSITRSAADELAAGQRFDAQAAPTNLTAGAVPASRRRPQPAAPAVPTEPTQPNDAARQPKPHSAVQRRRALLSALIDWQPGSPAAWSGAVLWPAQATAQPRAETSPESPAAPAAPPPAQPSGDGSPSGLAASCLVRTARGEVLALPPALAAALRGHHADLPCGPDHPQAPVVGRLRGSVGRWTLGPDGPRFVPGDGRRGGTLSPAGLRRLQARAKASARALASASTEANAKAVHPPQGSNPAELAGAHPPR